LSEQETKEEPIAVKAEDDKVWLDLNEVEGFINHITNSLHSLAVSISSSMEQVRGHIANNDSENKGESKDGEE
tara:strand:- start:13473 stop:13691 length:219 start_codon:yes stop_codon:yes gene_type:complete